jgi:hypothetical protein
VYLALALAALAAAPGDLDRSFADGGRVAYPSGTGGYATGLALRDNRPLLSVTAPTPAVLRLTASGKVASRTAGAPRFAGDYALTDAGVLSRIGSATSVKLAVPEGQEVAAFGVDGQGRAVLLMRYRGVILRFLPDGSLDPGYAGRVGDPSAFAVLVRRDGGVRVLASDDRRDTRVMALDARGRRVPGFHTRTLMQGRFPRYTGPRTIVAGPGGTLLVAGGGLGRSGWVARLRADGRADRRFGDRGLAVIPDFNANAAARDSRGRIVLGGIGESRADPYQAAVTRLTPRGRPDRRFGVVVRQLGAARGVRLVASEIRFVAIDDRDRIVVAGEAYDDEYILRDDTGRSLPAIARLHG